MTNIKGTLLQSFWRVNIPDRRCIACYLKNRLKLDNIEKFVIGFNTSKPICCRSQSIRRRVLDWKWPKYFILWFPIVPWLELSWRYRCKMIKIMTHSTLIRKLIGFWSSCGKRSGCITEQSRRKIISRRSFKENRFTTSWRLSFMGKINFENLQSEPLGHRTILAFSGSSVSTVDVLLTRIRFTFVDIIKIFEI